MSDAASPLLAMAMGFTLADVVKAKQPVMALPASATVEEALAFLEQRKVLSVPVLARGPSSPDGSPFRGVCSLWDLVSAVCFQPLFRAYAGERLTRELLRDEQVDEALRLEVFRSPVSEVLGVSDESARVPVVPWTDTLGSAVGALARRGTHRMLVRGEGAGADAADYRFLSQTDAVRFLYDALVAPGTEPLDPLLARSVRDLGVVAGGDDAGVVSGSTAESALACFRRLVLRGVRAMPVLDAETGRVAGTLSSSDLRGIGRATFKNTLLPVAEYLAVAQAGPGGRPGPRAPVTCSPDDSLARVAGLVREHGVHRVWVCEGGGGKVVGCVSLTDILSAFYHKPS